MADQQTPDFHELTTRLMAYGLVIFAELGIGGRNIVIGGVGLSVEDFVNKVLLEYATGEISYHPSRGSLMALLGTALKNDVLDALDRSSHDLEESRSVMPAAREEKKGESDRSLDEFQVRSHRPIDQFLEEQAYVKRLKEALQGEPDLITLVDLVVELGLEKPKEMADFLNIDIQELHNLRRKLRRRLLEKKLITTTK